MKNFLICLFLVIFGSLIFILVFRGVTGNPSAAVLADSVNDAIRPFGTTTDRGRFVLTRELAEHHTFALTREEAEAASPDAGYFGGHWYVLYAPGLSILAVPFYIIGSYFNMQLVGAFATSTFFALGNLIFIYFICKKVLQLPYWASVFASLTFGFGSVAMGYTSTLFQHHATTFFIISSFFAVYQYKHHKKWGFVWGLYVWLAYSIAIAIDYPNAILMLPVMVYFLAMSVAFKQEHGKYRISLRSTIVVTSILFFALTFLHGYYNNIHFGGWAKLSSNLPDFRQGIDRLVDNGNRAQAIATVTESKTSTSPVSVFKEVAVMNGASELLFAPDKGIFIFCPIFILGFLGLFYAFKNSDWEAKILISLVGVNLLLYASWGDPWGGWVFGPRYLIPSMAVLSIFVGYFLVAVRYKLVAKISAYVLYVVSSAIALLGALTTNSIPPKDEAQILKIKYGIPYDIDFLKQNRSNDLLFNSFFHTHISLIQYLAIILGILMIVAFLVLFILPKFENHEPDHIN